MSLHPDWKTILKHAWSIRLLVIAGVLSGLEALVPFLPTLIPISPLAIALLTPLTICAALIARLVAQKSITGKTNDAD